MLRVLVVSEEQSVCRVGLVVGSCRCRNNAKPERECFRKRRQETGEENIEGIDRLSHRKKQLTATNFWAFDLRLRIGRLSGLGPQTAAQRAREYDSGQTSG